MSEDWLNRIARDLARTGLGTVLSLGRWGHGFIDALPRDAARHILQLEPDPKRARNLERAARPEQAVLACAFGPADGTGRLHQFTMASLAALRPATGLITLFSGLRETGVAEVRTCTAATLMEQVELDGERPNLLILGAPGEEVEAITQWTALGALDSFEHVLTPLPRLPLYNGAADATELLALLEDQGFRVSHRDDADLDRPLALLQRDPVWARLIQERDSLKAELKTAQAALAEAHEAAGRAQSAFAAERDAFKAELETVLAARDASTAREDSRAARIAEEMARLDAQLILFQSILLAETG